MRIKSCNCFKLNEEQGIVFPVEQVLIEKGNSIKLRKRYVGESKYKNKNNPFVYEYCPLCGKKIEYDDEEQHPQESDRKEDIEE